MVSIVFLSLLYLVGIGRGFSDKEGIQSCIEMICGNLNSVCLFSIITLLNWYFNLNNLEIELLRYMTTIRWMSVRQGFFIDSVLRCSRSTWMCRIFHRIGDACCKWSIRFAYTWYNTTSFNNGDFNYGGMTYTTWMEHSSKPSTTSYYHQRHICSYWILDILCLYQWYNENSNHYSLFLVGTMRTTIRTAITRRVAIINRGVQRVYRIAGDFLIGHDHSFGTTQQP